MAPKPPSSDDPTAAAADDPAASELDRKLGAQSRSHRVAGRQAGCAGAVDDEDEDDEDDELELDDDEEDEDLVVFTAKEAAGALATVYRFVRPFLKNYKKCWPSSASACWSRRCSTSSCR